jgi:hypothetical protein
MLVKNNIYIYINEKEIQGHGWTTSDWPNWAGSPSLEFYFLFFIFFIVKSTHIPLKLSKNVNIPPKTNKNTKETLNFFQ